MRLDGADWKAGVLMFRTSDPEAIRLSASFKPGDYDFTPHKEKRSRDANAYMWTIAEQIAQKTFGMDKNEIYRRAVQRVGIYKDFCLTEDEARTFRVSWERLGTGWVTEQVDYDPDGERVIVRAYYGSSTYNTRQMSRLIDDLVQDAAALGIETDMGRIRTLLEEWETKHGS